AVVDGQLPGAQQWHVTEPQRPGGGGREFAVDVIGGGEDDADEILVVDVVAGQHLLHQPLRLLRDLVLGVGVERDRPPQSEEPGPRCRHGPRAYAIPPALPPPGPARASGRGRPLSERAGWRAGPGTRHPALRGRSAGAGEAGGSSG